MNTNISKTFKSVRAMYGLSQEDFAALLGCSRVGLSNYETGKTKNPGAEKYHKLLRLRELKLKGRGEKHARNTTS